MPRAYTEGFVLAALGLMIQFVVLAWGYLDPAHGPGKSIWLHPGLACAAGFTLALLHDRLRRRRRSPGAPE